MGPRLSDFESDEEDNDEEWKGPLTEAGYDWDLSERVSKLTDNNANLRAELREKDSQVEELSDALLAMQKELEAAENALKSDPMQAQFKDLVKKNRQLHLALEREKSNTMAFKSENKRLKEVRVAMASIPQHQTDVCDFFTPLPEGRKSNLKRELLQSLSRIFCI